MKREKLFILLIISMFLFASNVNAEEVSNLELQCYSTDRNVNNSLTSLDAGEKFSCFLGYKLPATPGYHGTKLTGDITFTDNVKLLAMKYEEDAWTKSYDGKHFEYVVKNSNGSTEEKNFIFEFVSLTSVQSQEVKIGINNLKLETKEEYTFNPVVENTFKTSDCGNGLKSLSIDGVTFDSIFNTDITTYNGTSTSKSIKINATALCSNASIAGTGVKTLTAGTNTYNIVVTSEQNIKKTYTININYEEQKSVVNTLKSLTIKEAKIKFDKDTLEYNIDIDKEVSKLTISYEATDTKSTVKVEGNKDFKEGENTVKITVTSESGSKKVYTIIATKETTDGSLLKSLKITDDNSENISLSPTFKSATKTYTIKVPSDAKKINITAECLKSGCEITGDGEVKIADKVAIKVKNGDKTSTYTINIETEEEELDATVSKKSNTLLIVIIIIILLLGGGAAYYFLIFKKLDKNNNHKPPKKEYIPPKKEKENEEEDNSDIDIIKDIDDDEDNDDINIIKAPDTLDDIMADDDNGDIDILKKDYE